MAEYRTKVTYDCGDFHNSLILEAYNFIVPINPNYVPGHLYDKFPLHYDISDIFCYTRYGIISLPRDIIERIKWGPDT